jgi:hypothetical protein
LFLLHTGQKKEHIFLSPSSIRVPISIFTRESERRFVGGREKSGAVARVPARKRVPAEREFRWWFAVTRRCLKTEFLSPSFLCFDLLLS